MRLAFRHSASPLASPRLEVGGKRVAAFAGKRIASESEGMRLPLGIALCIPSPRSRGQLFLRGWRRVIPSALDITSMP